MDNGTSTLSSVIISNFETFEKMEQYHFYIPKNLAKQDSDSLIKSYQALGRTVLKDLSLLDDQATTAWKTLATGGDLDALFAL